MSATAPAPGWLDGESALRAMRSLQATNDGFLTDPRQIRHQARNALRRIICVLEEFAGRQSDAAAHALATDLQRRIALASVSDALFGCTSVNKPFDPRFAALCRGVVAILKAPGQEIRLDVIADVRCPTALRQAVLRAAHEFVGNAVRHGMHARVAGQIEARLQMTKNGVRLVVSDDGWGCAGAPAPGEGLSLVRRLAAGARGSVGLERRGGRTVATLDLPHRGRAVAAQ